MNTILPENRQRLLTFLFILLSAAILLFLAKAPPESTARLPEDDIHLRFHLMGKKEAEKHCAVCHSPRGQTPLPEKHPPSYRCLFCHKKR